ncbi:MAG: anti-sigma factor family protein [Thermoanaerobaculia bacterium]
MTRGTQEELMRLLHGELPPERARELRERLAAEPELAGAYQRLERTWNGLDLPPAAPVPAGLSGRVMAHARSLPRPARGLSWSAAPVWVRATAAAALIAGAALGAGVGRSWPAAETASADSASATVSSLSGSEYNLADGYWDVIEDATSTSGSPELQR